MPLYAKSTVATARFRRAARILAIGGVLAAGAVRARSAAANEVPHRPPPAAQPGARALPGARMDARSAQALAESVSRRLKGTRVVAVTANGSLLPVFDENAFLVVEPARPEMVRIGDIITYEHPRLHREVVQRVLRPRDLPIGAGTPVMRVVVIIYTRDNAGLMGLAKAEDRRPAGAVGAAAAAPVR